MVLADRHGRHARSATRYRQRFGILCTSELNEPRRQGRNAGRRDLAMRDFSLGRGMRTTRSAAGGSARRSGDAVRRGDLHDRRQVRRSMQQRVQRHEIELMNWPHPYARFNHGETMKVRVASIPALTFLFDERSRAEFGRSGRVSSALHGWSPRLLLSGGAWRHENRHE